MKFNFRIAGAVVGLGIGLVGCGTDATSEGYKIVPDTGTSFATVAGDAFKLKVVEAFSDDSQRALPTGAVVAWTAPATVHVLEAESTEDSPVPERGATPTAFFVDNAQRPERAADLAGVLFVIDAGTPGGGTTTVSATITGSATGTVSASITVGATPAGNATRGAALYATGCAGCHGATGSGSPANNDGTTYTFEGQTFDYPAPGLNSEDENLAGDPDWNPALFAMAARGDFDDAGVVLRKSMPDWLNTTIMGHVPTTQDFADIYAFLKTQ